MALGRLLGNIASQFIFIGDLRGADARIRQSLAIERETGREDFVLDELATLGKVLYLEGNLSESEKMLDESLAIARRINYKQSLGELLATLGDLRRWQGRTDEARSQYQQAQTVWSSLDDQQSEAVCRLSLAELTVEEGREGGEVLAREAGLVLQEKDNVEDQVWERAVLAKALVLQGKRSEAQKEMDAAGALVMKIENKEVQLKFTMANALTRAASGESGDQAAALKILDGMLLDATRHNFTGYVFETRLVLGEIEMKSGHNATGSSRLAALEKDAHAKGFLLLAQKAATAAKGSFSVFE